MSKVAGIIKVDCISDLEEFLAALDYKKSVNLI